MAQRDETTGPTAPVPGDDDAPPAFDPATTDRPDPKLLTYYLMIAALTVVGFPFVILPLYFKYHTLRYKFDDKGVAMSWGLLFRKEIYLTYRRIQDIHVTRNLFHRWLGLADVAVQTASGSSGAEMTIEGIRNPEALRDFLYARMRGTEVQSTDAPGDADEQVGGDHQTTSSASDEALALLREIRDSLRETASHSTTPTASPEESETDHE